MANKKQTSTRVASTRRPDTRGPAQVEGQQETGGLRPGASEERAPEVTDQHRVPQGRPRGDPGAAAAVPHGRCNAALTLALSRRERG